MWEVKVLGFRFVKVRVIHQSPCSAYSWELMHVQPLAPVLKVCFNQTSSRWLLFSNWISKPVQQVWIDRQNQCIWFAFVNTTKIVLDYCQAHSSVFPGEVGDGVGGRAFQNSSKVDLVRRSKAKYLRALTQIWKDMWGVWEWQPPRSHTIRAI